MKYKNFAREIKSLREEMNLTQKEFADMLGYSPKTISSWESGLTCPYAEGTTFKALITEKTGKDLALIDSAVREDLGIPDFKEKSSIKKDNKDNTSVYAMSRPMDKDDTDYTYLLYLGGALPILTLYSLMALMKNQERNALIAIIIIIILAALTPVYHKLIHFNTAERYKLQEVKLSMLTLNSRMKGLQIKTLDKNAKDSYDVVLTNYTVDLDYIEAGFLTITEHKYSKVQRGYYSNTTNKRTDVQTSYFIWLIDTDIKTQNNIIQMLLNRSNM